MPSVDALPVELQLSVFLNLHDLDDVSYLSQTCRTLRTTHSTWEATVKRSVILNSPMYKYDFTLSKYQEVMDEVARIYSQNDDYVLDHKRPDYGGYLERLHTMCTEETLTNEIVERVEQNWKHHRYLRGLYLDAGIAREFEDFRSQFALPISKRARMQLAEPGLAISEDSPGLADVNQTLDLDFKDRFHQALCLTTIGILSRGIGLFSLNDNNSELTTSAGEVDLVADDIVLAWSRQRVISGQGKDAVSQDISTNMRFDCLEISDFLYMFLLRKILPHDKAFAWTASEGNKWPFEVNYYQRCQDEDIGDSTWYLFLQHMSWAILPGDIAELGRYKSWEKDSTYPADVHEYLKVRGVFDLGCSDNMDWFTCFERSSLVEDLANAAINPFYEMPHLPCWWDKVRANTGSPFRSEFVSKYKEEEPKIKTYSRETARLWVAEKEAGIDCECSNGDPSSEQTDECDFCEDACLNSRDTLAVDDSR